MLDVTGTASQFRTVKAVIPGCPQVVVNRSRHKQARAQVPLTQGITKNMSQQPACIGVLSRRSERVCFASKRSNRHVLIGFLLLAGVFAGCRGWCRDACAAELSEGQIKAFAQLAVQGIDKEYPNKPSNVMTGPDSVLSPRAMHPVFYGCFDWHSSVHGHWLLVRLLKKYPQASVAPTIRELMDRQLTAGKLLQESEYFKKRENRSFERMYGWAWALRLAAELHTMPDPRAQVWRRNFLPLEEQIVKSIRDYLPRLSYPIRTGVHPNTAFALAQIIDYADTVGDKSLKQLAARRCRDYYMKDRAYPTEYEPSGEDFFSGALNEADAMRRVLEPVEFSNWLDKFFPDLREGRLGNLLVPVEVSDLSDPKIVHLAGLDLSRAWALGGIASALPAEDPRAETLTAAARRHQEAGLAFVQSGHYEGEHWLASFAVYLLTHVGAE